MFNGVCCVRFSFRTQFCWLFDHFEREKRRFYYLFWFANGEWRITKKCKIMFADKKQINAVIIFCQPHIRNIWSNSVDCVSRSIITKANLLSIYLSSIVFFSILPIFQIFSIRFRIKPSFDSFL